MKNEVCCKDVMRHICENLEEELNSEKCKDIKVHLENCPCCTSYLKSVETTIECYRKYSIKLSEDVHENLMKKLGLE